MKKRNLFLMALIPIFLIGILFIVAGIALGGTLYSYQIKTDGNEEGFQDETITLSASDAESITGINWKIRTSEVKLVTGDSFGISGSGRYKSYVEDGIWYITTEKRIARISFLNHSIEIPSFLYHGWGFTDKMRKNTITIPANSKFKTATIQIAAGSLKGEELSADDLALKIGAGDCTLEQTIAQKLSVDVGAGSSTLTKLQVSETCTAEVGAGKLTLGSKKVASGVNSIANLKGDCSAGNMIVTGKVTGDSRLECSVGNMDVYLDGYYNNYQIDTHSEMGSIHVHEEEEHRDVSDDDHETDDNHEISNQFGNLSLKCSLGDITVKFQQE